MGVAIVLFIGWVLAWAIGGFMECRRSNEQIIRREFNNIDCRTGEYNKTVGYYRGGKKIVSIDLVLTAKRKAKELQVPDDFFRRLDIAATRKISESRRK